MRSADDADNQRALAVRQIPGGLAEIRAGRLFDAVRAGAEIDPVQIECQDLILGIVGFDAQGQGDFEEFPMQRFLFDFEAVAGELHGQGGGTLGEIAILDVSHNGPPQTEDVHAMVLEKTRVLAG